MGRGGSLGSSAGGARPARGAAREARARERIRRGLGRGRFSLLGGPLEHGPALELVARVVGLAARPPPRRRAAPASAGPAAA